MLSQLFLNSLIAGSLYALVGVSFALIYKVARFFHFTHGLVFSVGAYLCFIARTSFGFSTLSATCLAVAGASALGAFLGSTLFRALFHRRASSLVLLLASLGAYVVGQNVISLLFGDRTLSLRSTHITEGIPLFNGRITYTQVVIIGVASTTLILIGLVLAATRLGRWIRAVACDHDLARVVGIDVDRLMVIVFAIGSAVGGLAGVLWAIDQDITPTMGMRALLIGVVAMIVGGQRTVSGVAIAALLLALLQNYSLLIVPAAWQDAVVFVVLIGFLIVSPAGLFGIRSRRRSLS